MKMTTMTEMREEVTEEKAPGENLYEILQSKLHKNQTRMEKRQNRQSTPRSKGYESFKKQGEKCPKTPKRPSSVEDTKAKIQVSTEKGDSLPKVEGTSIDPVKNGFQMTGQEPV